MTNATHTPGPWGPYLKTQPYIIESKATEGAIVACLPLGDEWEANANLIAAAPDLLEIIEQCLKRGWMWDNDPSLYDAAAKVVRKAKGK